MASSHIGKLKLFLFCRILRIPSAHIQPKINCKKWANMVSNCVNFHDCIRDRTNLIRLLSRLQFCSQIVSSWPTFVTFTSKVGLLQYLPTIQLNVTYTAFTEVINHAQNWGFWTKFLYRKGWSTFIENGVSTLSCFLFSSKVVPVLSY